MTAATPAPNRRRRATARFTQADIARTLRAAKQEGWDHVRVEPDGAIVVHLFPSAAPVIEPEHEFARGLRIVP